MPRHDLPNRLARFGATARHACRCDRSLHPVATGYGAKNEMYVAYYGGDFYRNVHALDAPSLFAELARLRARNLRTIRKDPNLTRINRWDRVPVELWPEK